MLKKPIDKEVKRYISSCGIVFYNKLSFQVIEVGPLGVFLDQIPSLILVIQCQIYDNPLHDPKIDGYQCRAVHPIY
jgi:hypothetical protein